MKQEYKTIVAIETTINNHTVYISGHSHRFDDKVIPQFNTDPVHAKEFDSEEEASTYLPTVSNPHHRIYNVIAIDIPVIKDLKKYDRDKKKKVMAIPSLSKKPLTDVLMVFIACIVLVSCSKSQIAPAPKTVFNKYQMIVDHYSKDTTKMGVRTLWGQWYLPKDKNGGMDTLRGKVYINCYTDSTEHLYYTLDDQPVLPGIINKLRPSRIDTNWNNYYKKPN